jgi:hypothetical protein
MQPCYDGIPIVRYTHISSAITPFAGYNIMVSQLHRFQALITKRSSFVMEIAKLLVRMETRGYCMSVLRKKLHRHVTRFYYFIGETSPCQLLLDIWATVTALQTIHADGGDWEHQLPPDSESEELHLQFDNGSSMSLSEEVELEEIIG